MCARFMGGRIYFLNLFYFFALEIIEKNPEKSPENYFKRKEKNWEKGNDNNFS